MKQEPKFICQFMLKALIKMKYFRQICLAIAMMIVTISCKQVVHQNKESIVDSKQEVKNKLPSIRVLDTDFSKGRLGLEHTLSLTDLEKFHGHLCDGLVIGFLGIKEGLQQLYPNEIIDRTNTRIVSKSSPCLTDVAVYITGGRYQFNSFYVDNTIENGFYIIQRKDNGKAIKVAIKKGVKPNEINELGTLAVKGELPACDLDKLKTLENNFSKKLLSENPKDNFIVTEVTDFEWNPILENGFTKTDILNKNKPNCNQ